MNVLLIADDDDDEVDDDWLMIIDDDDDVSKVAGMMNISAVNVDLHVHSWLLKYQRAFFHDGWRYWPVWEHQ